MELMSTIVRVFGSLTIEMSTVQSVQFTHGEAGAIKEKMEILIPLVPNGISARATMTNLGI